MSRQLNLDQQYLEQFGIEPGKTEAEYLLENDPETGEQARLFDQPEGIASSSWRYLVEPERQETEQLALDELYPENQGRDRSILDYTETQIAAD